MTDVEIRLLATMLRLRSFTTDRLAAESGINAHSARSWLRRNIHLVTRQESAVGGDTRRGRPRALWQLRSDTEKEARAQLAQVYPLGAPIPSFNLKKAGYLNDIEVAEDYLRLWRKAAERKQAEAAELAHAAAQSRITAAWLSFADLDASGHSVAQSVINQLAALEAELGIAQPSTSDNLEEIANWIAERIKRMIGAGASASFAARVLAARAGTQPLSWQTRLLVASYAASVWADERMTGERSGLTAEDFRRCILVTDLTPIARRLEMLGSALKSPAALAVRWTADQRQAALLGLAARDYQQPTLEVRRWFRELPDLKVGWAEELALAVWYGVGESLLHSGRVFRELRGSVREGIAITRSWPNLKMGRIRRTAIDWCQRKLDLPDRPDRLEPGDLQSAATYLLGLSRGHAEVDR